jgi:hypothetical protein
MARTFSFPSKTSPEKPPHKTTVHSDGSVMCSCKGFYHPKKCWHVKAVKAMYPLSDEKWALALSLIKTGGHHDLLQLILGEYPNITREELGKMIHVLCEWVCPLCCAEKQSPRGAGCTSCSPEEEPEWPARS